MSSFAMFLLEGGVDVEVAVDFAGITSFLTEESAAIHVVSTSTT